MRRILLPALVLALLVGTFAGVASARFAERSAPRDAASAAPFRAPAAMPAPDAAQPDAWTFRSSAAIGRQFEQAAGAPATAPGSGAAAVTVTAVVLPVVFVIVDDSGELVELVTNTEQRDARGVVYLVRAGSTDGAPVALDSAIWRQARVALASADAGTGTIWRA